MKTLHARFQLGRRRIGALLIDGYELPPFVSNEECYDILDSHSASAYQFAVMLCRGWEDIWEVSDCGQLLEFASVWVRREFAQGGWWLDASKQLIETVFPDYAAMFAKAFPLEYEGELGDESRYTPAFERRRRAMVRLLAGSFDMMQMPGASGREGWMWVPSPRSGRLPMPGEYELDFQPPTAAALVPEKCG